jgi:hypothetical protein
MTSGSGSGSDSGSDSDSDGASGCCISRETATERLTVVTAHTREAHSSYSTHKETL